MCLIYWLICLIKKKIFELKIKIETERAGSLHLLRMRTTHIAPIHAKSLFTNKRTPTLISRQNIIDIIRFSHAKAHLKSQLKLQSVSLRRDVHTTRIRRFVPQNTDIAGEIRAIKTQRSTKTPTPATGVSRVHFKPRLHALKRLDGNNGGAAHPRCSPAD